MEKTQLRAESQPGGLEAVCLSARCWVPWLSPSSNFNLQIPFGGELALACSILQCGVWCRADTPLKVPGKQSDTGNVGIIREMQFKIYT